MQRSLVRRIFTATTYILTYSMKHSLSWETSRFSASQEIPRILLEPEGSLSHPQVPATCPYPESVRSNPLLTPLLWYVVPLRSQIFSSTLYYVYKDENYKKDRRKFRRRLFCVPVTSKSSNIWQLDGVTSSTYSNMRCYMQSRITSTKSPSFYTTTYGASLTNLMVLLPQSHDCS
jgi:hypothetical protein